MAIPVGTAVGYLTLDYTDFSKNLKTAVSEANSLSGKFADTLGSGLTTVGENISSVGTTLTTGITLPLAAAAGASVKFGAEFDKGMSNVKAVSGATQEEFEEMRNAAIRWGEKTVYTAAEASDALYYMGLAGWGANESVAALGPVLNLAAAGNLELGRTSDIVTDAMTALQMEATEYTNGVANAEHFTNVLAAAMSNSNTDVDQMGEAFKYVAPLAGALGYKSEDLALALGNMANVGVKASQAGTGLRQALKNLITPANDTAAALMDELGISLFDTQGNALEFKDVLDNLRTVFGGVEVDIAEMSDVLEKEGEEGLESYVDALDLTMTEQEKLQAIVEIFGTRALPGVLGIINASEDKYNDLADAIYSSDKAFVQHGNDIMTYEEAVEKFGEELVNTSGEFQVLGAAEGMAMTQMDNLQGDWTKFTSALGTSQIEITDLVNGALRELVQKLTELVTWFNGLDDEQQKNILKWAGIIAAIGPVLLIFGKTISFVGKTITVFNTIGQAITKIRTGFGLLSRVMAPTIQSFSTLFRTLGPLKGSLALVKGALASISLPVVAAVVIIGSLIAMFTHLMKTNDEFREKVYSIWDGIKAKFEEAGERILNAINEMGFNFDSLTEALKAAFDWLSNTLAPFFLGFLDTLSTAIGAVLDIVVGVFEIIGGLFKGFREGDWSLFTQGLETFFGGLFDLLSTPFVLAFNVITEYLEAFGTSWSEVWEAIKQFFIDIADAITKTIDDVFTSISEWWDGLIQGFLNFHKNLWDSIALFLYNIVMSIANFILSIVNKVQDFIANIKSKVEEFKKSLIEKVTTFVERTILKIFELYIKVANYFIQLRDSIKNKVQEIVKTVIDKFVEMKEKTIAKVQEIKDGIIKKFDDIREKFKQIGSNIINGIWDGINAGWDWLKGKVRDLANSLFEAAKSALGISSPSKVFREGFGRWIPLGAALGVEDTMPEAVDQIQEAFDDGLSQIDGEVDIDNPFGNMIYLTRDAIEDVTVWFETIEERLSEAAVGIRDTLQDILDTGNSVVTPDGYILGGGGKPSDSLKPAPRNSGDNGGENVVNNYYYTFNSPKAIDEIEAARKLKETQRDLSEGF